MGTDLNDTPHLNATESPNNLKMVASHDEKLQPTISRRDSRVHQGHHAHDKALEALGSERVVMTDEQSRHVCRKIDKHIMPFLMWVYFLQILDKSCVGYAATFGLKTDANLSDENYSMISSAGYWAQLALCCGPTAFLIVRIPTKWLMSSCILFWGTSMVGLAFSKEWRSLLANRFLLGLFEAVCIPLFTVITTTWYRRREQPLRIAMWYGTNGIASILGSLLTWALSFIKSPHLHIYQILFLLVGLATMVTAPIIFFFLDNNPAEARFLTPEEKKWAIERLRDNNTGVEAKEFQWYQVLEVFTSPQTYFYFFITFCVNCGASVTNTFGPLIIKSFGFSSRQTILLNMPFGFVQTCVCVVGCVMAARFGYKSLVLIGFMLPCVMGAGLLYGLGRAKKDSGPLLFGYYCIAFLFGGNPLLFSWLAANTGGHTKKSLAISMCNAGSAVGNIVGPFLFKTGAPVYHAGLGGVMGIFIACIALTVSLMFIIAMQNKGKERERVANGKPAKMVNASMDKEYRNTADQNLDANGNALGQQAFADMTDRENDEFVYSY